MTIAAEGRIEQYQEGYDRLLISESDLQLRENVLGEPPSELRMAAGEVRWIPRGATHAIENVGKSAVTFITLEFQ